MRINYWSGLKPMDHEHNTIGGNFLVVRLNVVINPFTAISAIWRSAVRPCLKKYKKSTVHAIDTQQSLKGLEMTILVLFLI